jgi:hypothetical protein
VDRAGKRTRGVGIQAHRIRLRLVLQDWLEGPRIGAAIGVRGQYRRGGSIKRRDQRGDKGTRTTLEDHGAGAGVNHPRDEGPP